MDGCVKEGSKVFAVNVKGRKGINIQIARTQVPGRRNGDVIPSVSN